MHPTARRRRDRRGSGPQPPRPTNQLRSRQSAGHPPSGDGRDRAPRPRSARRTGRPATADPRPPLLPGTPSRRGPRSNSLRPWHSPAPPNRYARAAAFSSEAQSTARNRPGPRGLDSWTARAMSALPEPLGPRSSKGERCAAWTTIASRVWRVHNDWPTSMALGFAVFCGTVSIGVLHVASLLSGVPLGGCRPIGLLGGNGRKFPHAG